MTIENIIAIILGAMVTLVLAIAIAVLNPRPGFGSTVCSLVLLAGGVVMVRELWAMARAFARVQRRGAPRNPGSARLPRH